MLIVLFIFVAPSTHLLSDLACKAEIPKEEAMIGL